MTRLLAFLFESDLPVALQVFWKLLTLTMAATLAYAAHEETARLEGQILLYAFASIFLLASVFTKLGDR